MGIPTPDEAKLPKWKSIPATLPKLSEGLRNKDRCSHLCLLMVTAVGDIYAHTCTLSLECLPRHDASFNCSVTVIEEVS